MTTRVRTSLLTLAALAATAVLGAVPAAVQAAPVQVASGNTAPDGSGFPWRVGVERRSLAGLAALCFELDHSWTADGSSFGNIAGNCVAGRVGNRFSLSAGACQGIFAVLGRGSYGDRTIRKLAFATDPRARRVRLTFRGGGRTTVRTHAAPRALHLPVRLAWLVDGGGAFPARAVAYGARNAVVARWRAGTGC